MKKLTSVLLTVVMLLSVLCMPTQAANEVDSLSAVASTSKGSVTVTINATEATTNGKFTVEFNADHLVYAGCEINGFLTHEDEGDGIVTFSYAASTSDATAPGATIIKIRFLVVTNWSSTDINVTVLEFNEHESLNQALPTISVNHPGAFDVPSEPSDDPIPSIPPTVPADPPAAPDEEEDKPGINIVVPELTEVRYNAILAQYPDADNHWAEENIVKAINAGLFNGTSENTFTPNGVVTRGMFVTLLYRLSGAPEVTGDMVFTDVASTQYYADAVKWAYENNIVNGLTATEFAPGKEVTREQMVTMLYRYANAIGDDTDASTSLNGFGDSAKVSSWAAEAMSWAVAEGIINGSGGNLTPADQSTRAQIATVLVRYVGL